MKFDFTHDKEPRYSISIYAWDTEDKLYFSRFYEAFVKWQDLCECEWDDGTFLALRDIESGEIKARRYFGEA